MPRSRLPGAELAETTIVTFATGEAIRETRPVAEEVAVGITYANIPYAVMMATPEDLEDFALGFSLTEGVIGAVEDVRGIAVEPDGTGVRVVVDLVPQRLHGHLARRRALTGRTGCGLCGVEDFEHIPEAARRTGTAPRIAVPAIARALDALEERQPLNAETRAVHGAAFADLQGNIVAVREDVGRHNALDKLIGALLSTGTSPDAGFVVVTSRASFEMVEKVAAFGTATLVAISAPTSLALERARHHDMTLVGIARRDTMTVFTGADRLVSERAPA